MTDVFDYTDLKHYMPLCSLGNSGAVMLLKDKESGRLLVRKQIEKKYIEIYSRLKTLNEKNLVKVYDIVSIGDAVYAIEEYINGITLSQLLDAEREFTADECIYITSQICDAAGILHSIGIIHRDINPNNIMINDDLKIKLIDFDISRVHNNNGSRDTTILGTQGYVAPEQFGFKQTDVTADVFSIGKILEDLIDTNEQLSEGFILNQKVRKCTMFNPSERYQNTQQLKNSLNRYLWQDTPTMRRITSLIPGFSTPNTKYTGLRIFLFCAALTVIIGVFYTGLTEASEYWITTAGIILAFVIPYICIADRKRIFTENRFFLFLRGRWRMPVMIAFVVLCVLMGAFVLLVRHAQTMF